MDKSLQRAFFRWSKFPPLLSMPTDPIAFQDSLLRLTLHSELYKKYPIPQSKARSFIKHLILTLEEAGIEVREEFYSFVLSQNDGPYRTYWIKCGSTLSLKEDLHLISSGTTGLRTWPAALALSEYLLERPDWVKGKVVLELGSGSGYLGLSLAVSSLASKVILTDCHPEVLSVLSDNNLANGGLGEVRELDWSRPSELATLPGLIVASDVVFDPSILKDLCQTLQCAMAEGAEAYVACTERNAVTLKKFEEELSGRGLAYETVHVDESENFRVNEGDPSLPIRIYHIWK